MTKTTLCKNGALGNGSILSVIFCATYTGHLTSCKLQFGCSEAQIYLTALNCLIIILASKMLGFVSATQMLCSQLNPCSHYMILAQSAARRLVLSSLHLPSPQSGRATRRSSMKQLVEARTGFAISFSILAFDIKFT